MSDLTTERIIDLQNRLRIRLAELGFTGVQVANYFALGRKKEADSALAEYVVKYHADAAFQIAEIYALRNETEKALEWLERAYAASVQGKWTATPLLLAAGQLSTGSLRGSITDPSGAAVT